MPQFPKTAQKSINQLVKHWQVCFGFGLLAAIAWGCWLARETLFDPHLLSMVLQISPCCVVLLFLGTYIILTIIGVPGTVLTLAGGLLFGLSWGTFWSVLGATIGAMGAFWMARYTLQGWIYRRFGNHPTLKTLNRCVRQNPLSFVLAIRFAPISPFNVVNFLFGLTPIHWLPYSLGTLIGIVPGTLIYTWLGVSGKTALSGGDRLPFLLALLTLGALSFVAPYLIRWRSPHSS